MDELYRLNVSGVYQGLAENIVNHLGLNCTALNLDSTSMHVDGPYNADGEQTSVIKLTKGYSRDHQPELNQVIINLITENQAGIPVYMQACSGNTNDSDGFKRIVKSHINSLKKAHNNRYLIADSALYSEEIIKSLSEQKQLFITRVPQKIKQAKEIIRCATELIFSHITQGYTGYWVDSNYGDIAQRWLVVKSEQAYKREIITLDKRLKKDALEAIKSFEKLSKKNVWL